MTFKQRKLRVKITLSRGAFSGKENDTLEVSGLAVSATVDEFPFGNKKAMITIRGLSVSDMARMTTLSSIPVGNIWERNQITLTVDEPDGTTTIIFHGYIFQSVANFNAAPDIPMQIYAEAYFFQKMTVPNGGMAFPGGTPVADVMQVLAFKGGWGFRNHGVTKVTRDLSLNGNLFDMLRQVSQSENINFFVEADILHIVNFDWSRTDVVDEEISTKTGLVGYPIVTEFGCTVQCVFSLKYRMQMRVDVDFPEVPIASGMMTVNSLTHRLDTELTNGAWFTFMDLQRTAEDVSRILSGG